MTARIRTHLGLADIVAAGISSTREDGHWSDYAACLDERDLFDESRDHGEGRGKGRDAPEEHWTVREAKKVCAGCPVLQECRDHVLANPDPYGVLGGWNPADRERIARSRKRKR